MSEGLTGGFATACSVAVNLLSESSPSELRATRRREAAAAGARARLNSPIKRVYWSTVVGSRRDVFTAMIHAAREAGELPPGPDPSLVQDLLARPALRAPRAEVMRLPGGHYGGHLDAHLDAVCVQLAFLSQHLTPPPAPSPPLHAARSTATGPA